MYRQDGREGRRTYSVQAATTTVISRGESWRDGHRPTEARIDFLRRTDGDVIKSGPVVYMSDNDEQVRVTSDSWR